MGAPSYVNLNSQSGRYTPFEENDFYAVERDGWRLQAQDNKQASEGYLTDGQWLTEALVKHYDEGFRLYQAARKPASHAATRLFLAGFAVYYTWVAKIDAHNLMHFLRLRMANDAQYEIRQYARQSTSTSSSRRCPGRPRHSRSSCLAGRVVYGRRSWRTLT